MAPILLGAVPFGMIAGVATVAIGLGPRHALGLSAIVFAGAAQLATVELLGNGAPLVVVVATALIINARFVMYSASLAPYLRPLPTRQKALVAYLLTDQAYAFSINRYVDVDESPRRRLGYYLGAALTLWLTWQISNIAGAVLGAAVPEAWSLDFAVPLVFIALLVPAVRDRSDLVAALVAGGLAVAGADLPLNLGLPVAATGGIVAGMVSERFAR